jgi:hypothetical protein
MNLPDVDGRETTPVTREDGSIIPSALKKRKTAEGSQAGTDEEGENVEGGKDKKQKKAKLGKKVQFDQVQL